MKLPSIVMPRENPIEQVRSRMPEQLSRGDIAQRIRKQTDTSGRVPVEQVEQVRRSREETRQSLQDRMQELEKTRQDLKEETAGRFPGVTQEEVQVTGTEQGFEAQIQPDNNLLSGVGPVEDNILNAALPENQENEIQQFQTALSQADEETKQEFDDVIRGFREKRADFREGVAATFEQGDPEEVADNVENILETQQDLESEDLEQDLEEFEEENPRQGDIAGDLVGSAQDAFDEDSIDTVVGNVDREADEVTALAEELARGEEEAEQELEQRRQRLQTQRQQQQQANAAQQNTENVNETRSLEFRQAVGDLRNQAAEQAGVDPGQVRIQETQTDNGVRLEAQLEQGTELVRNVDQNRNQDTRQTQQTTTDQDTLAEEAGFFTEATPQQTREFIARKENELENIPEIINTGPSGGPVDGPTGTNQELFNRFELTGRQTNQELIENAGLDPVDRGFLAAQAAVQESEDLAQRADRGLQPLDDASPVDVPVLDASTVATSTAIQEPVDVVASGAALAGSGLKVAEPLAQGDISESVDRAETVPRLVASGGQQFAQQTAENPAESLNTEVLPELIGLGSAAAQSSSVSVSESARTAREFVTGDLSTSETVTPPGRNTEIQTERPISRTQFVAERVPTSNKGQVTLAPTRTRTPSTTQNTAVNTDLGIDTPVSAPSPVTETDTQIDTTPRTETVTQTQAQIQSPSEILGVATAQTQTQTQAPSQTLSQAVSTSTSNTSSTSIAAAQTATQAANTSATSTTTSTTSFTPDSEPGENQDTGFAAFFEDEEPEPQEEEFTTSLVGEFFDIGLEESEAPETLTGLEARQN